MIGSVVGLVEDHVGAGGSQFFWINSRTLALCSCFTIECGSPGISKSMSSSILSRVNSLSVLSVVISRNTSGLFCTATLCLSSCPDLSWVCSTRISPVRFVWALITLCVISGCPDRSEEQKFSWEDFSLISRDQDENFTLISLDQDVFAFINKHFVFVIRLPWSITDWFWDWLDWLEEFCLSRNFSSWLSNNFFFWLWINFWNPILLSNRDVKRSLAEVVDGINPAPHIHEQMATSNYV